MAIAPTVDDPVLSPISDFEGVRAIASPQERATEITARARRFREGMLAEQSVVYYRSFDLQRVPYPKRYALRDACPIPIPLIHIINRMFVIQFQTEAGLKTLLVSASDIHANAETPFFRRMADGFGPFKEQLTPVLAPEINTVEQALAKTGIKPEDVDYITYDHMHTQDVRHWLGTNGKPGYFPNARLLIMRQEYLSTRSLLPPQLDWYCPHGIDGIPDDKFVLLDGDTLLGKNVALIHTPGHTEGNHSIAVRTPEGVMVTSENGVGPDSYNPRKSGIPGLRKYAEQTGTDIILNSNTLERGLDQYVSMVQEREIAGPSQRNPDFYNVVSSSELTGYWLFPGIKPTFRFGELEFGRPVIGKE
jgi:hypothetical protein